MFFSEHQSRSQGLRASVEDEAYAERLRKVAQRDKLLRHWSKTKWSEQFRLLRKSLANNTDRIEAVLKYLEGCPEHGFRNLSAKWLRDNFAWLEERAKKYLPKPDQPNETAEKLFRGLTTILYWNPHRHDELRTTIYKSVENYEEFLRRLLEVANRSTFSSGFATWLWPQLNQTHEFLYQWFVRVWQQTNTLGEGKVDVGQSSRYVFSVDHYWFTHSGLWTYSHRYYGSSSYWNILLTDMGYSSEGAESKRQ